MPADGTDGRRSPRGALAALVLSVAALTAAAGAGFVSEAEATSYTWAIGEAAPPASSAVPLPVAQDGDGFSPLLLSAHVAARLEVRWSCGVAAGLGGDGPRVLMRSVRRQETGGGLTLEVSGDVYLLSAGGLLLGAVPVTPPEGAGCVYAAVVDDSGIWSLRRNDTPIATGETDLVLLTGIGSTLAAGGAAPGEFLAVQVDTAAHGPSSNVARTGLQIAAAALGAIVIILIVRGERQ